LASATALFMALNTFEILPLAFPSPVFPDHVSLEMLAWQPLGPWQQAFEFIYMLHTKQGAWGLGLAIGLMAMGVPIMAATGVFM